MAQRNTWLVLREAGSAWVDDNATQLSAAIAFYALLSIAPLLVIVTAIAGAVFGHDAATGALTEQLRELVGQSGAEVATTIIKHANKPTEGFIASGVGILTLLYGASGVFGQLQEALNAAWDVKPKAGRGIWKMFQDRFLSFGMVLVFGFLLLVSLVTTTILAVFSNYLGGLVPGLPLLMQIGNFVLGFLLTTVIFALMFKFLPDAKVVWRDVWFGAIITSTLFTIGKYLISIYLALGSVASPFGAAGSLVVFIVWVYYSGLIVLFGAELTKVTALHAGRRIQPTENAEPTKSNNGVGDLARNNGDQLEYATMNVEQ